MIRTIFGKLKNHIARRRSMKLFEKEFNIFEEKNDGRFELFKENCFPCLNDKTEYTPFDAHYIYHPAWAARVLAELKPEKHIDIASTLHFCSIVSAFIPTEFYDYRPARLNLNNLQY